jgi:hypothetical protein
LNESGNDMQLLLPSSIIPLQKLDIRNIAYLSSKFNRSHNESKEKMGIIGNFWRIMGILSGNC